MSDVHIAGLVVKIAERCNLNCSYCYMYNQVDRSYRNRPPFMAEPTFRSVLDRIQGHLLATKGRSFTITMHGGEPLLLPKSDFQSFARQVRDRFGLAVTLAIQTNATLVDDEWADILKRFSVHVGLSLDGPAQVHDLLRIDHSGRGSHAATIRGLRTLQAYGLKPGVLCVVNAGVSGLDTYRYFRSLGLRQINFLLPEVSHDSITSKSFAYYRDSTPIADYLIPVFDEWISDPEQLSVRLFEAMIRVILGGKSTTQAIGGPALDYLVVETDGSVHLNDCLKVCEEGLTDTGRSIFDSSLMECASSTITGQEMMSGRLPLPSRCSLCEERHVCGGGNIPNRFSVERRFDNPSVWCHDLKKIIMHVRGSITG